MDASRVYHLRAQAMVAFEEGRPSDAEARLDALISGIGSPQTRQMVDQLCQCLMDRATVRRAANRTREVLEDLALCEGLVPKLPPISQRAVMVNVHLLRAKLMATPYSDAYDREAALKSLAALRTLGWRSWAADELESELAFRGREWDRAADLALQVAAALEAEGWKRGAASCHLRAAKALLEMGDLNRTETELETAQRFLERWGPPDQLASSQLAMARLKSARGQHDDAWALATRALDGVESLIRHFRVLADQQRFLMDKLDYYSQAFTIGLTRGGRVGWLRAWAVAERAKSFYLCHLVANSDVALFEGVDNTDVERLRELEDRLDDCERALAATGAGARRDGLEEQLRLVSDQRQQLLSSMMKSNPRWAALRTPPEFDAGDALASLPPGWVPLSYFWQQKEEAGGATLFIFFSGRDRLPQCLSVSWSQQELVLLDACRERLCGEAELFSPVFPRELAAKVFPEQVRRALHDGDCLLISPHGRLRGIALHAADLGQKDYVINRWPVQYIPTLALLPLRRNDSLPDAVLLMGCPVNAFQGEELKEVADEIEVLSDLWSARRPGRVTRCIVPANGSPEQEGLPKEAWRQFQVLHFACHGHFPEGRPFDASLRLGTDALRTSELFTVRLQASLVCLSACSLGRQARQHAGVEVLGDEWAGLYLPLLYAGAHAVLASLWDANSQVAAVFMKALHVSLSEGASPALAFQQAMKCVNRKPAALWANWCLVGFPR